MDLNFLPYQGIKLLEVSPQEALKPRTRGFEAQTLPLDSGIYQMQRLEVAFALFSLLSWVRLLANLKKLWDQDFSVKEQWR